jgi:hypothetical protein
MSRRKSGEKQGVCTLLVRINKMTRFGMIMIGFVAGWVMNIGVMIFGYEGLPGLLLLPIGAAIVSALSVGLCILLGYSLRLSALRTLWHWSRYPHISVLVVAPVIFIIGEYMVLSEHFRSQHSNTTPDYGIFVLMVLVSYALIIFTLTNWPLINTKCEQSASADGAALAASRR